MPRNRRLGYNSDEKSHCVCMHVAPTPAVLTARGEKNIQLARAAGVHDGRCPHSTLHADTVRSPAKRREQAKAAAKKQAKAAARKRPVRRTVIS